MNAMPPLSERVGRPAPADLAAKRTILAEAITSGALPPAKGQAVETIGGVRTLRFGPLTGAATTIAHFHGGGYRQGAPEVASGYAAALAEATGATVFCPTYRLAPEAPFPAALNDAIRVVADLAGRGGRLILAGDSAGGGLAAALTGVCLTHGLPIAALILHSPWLDLTVKSMSYRANADTDCLFSEAAAGEAAEMYLQGHSAADPLTSPLFADLAAFPPTFISVGSGEVLLDDAVAFHRRLLEASREVRLLVIPEMAHVAVTRSLELPGSREVLDATLSFLADLR